ncbi:MAG: ATP-binding protein [Phycisphaerae bacterium]|nr:ATP-binding protein [Phycisphaerae bacterium]
MKPHVLIYRVGHLPDSAFPRYRLLARADVPSAVRGAQEHLLRVVASRAPQSVAVSVRLAFTPAPKSGNVQDRLAIFLIINAPRKETASSFRALIESSALVELYTLQAVEECSVPWEVFAAAHDIARAEGAVDPLHSAEFNPRIPPVYYTIDPFTPTHSNDGMKLDSVLSRLNEPALIDICVEPTCVRTERTEHTRDLARLQAINRSSDFNDAEDGAEPDPFCPEDRYARRGRSTVMPLRYKDPLADDILRQRRSFHETLSQPHLAFHARVLAKTPEVAHLLVSTVAESAFDGGSYRLFACRKGECLFDQALQAVRDHQVLGFPTHDLVLGVHASTYSGLSRLGHVATVDELAGVWCLPVASYGSPCCIRRNTDPPQVPHDRLITVGFDGQHIGASESRVLRGIRDNGLPKHWFISGVPGSGKTVSTFNTLLQLSRRGTPFLVIETANTQYRILKTLSGSHDAGARELAEQLKVHTPGVEIVSPFRLNPLWHPEGIARDEHIENLLVCFQAAMAMSGPLPGILGEALERVYDEQADPDTFPVMHDLCAAAQAVLSEKSYSADLKSDLAAALEVRLGKLIRRTIGRMFQCGTNVPGIDELMRSYSILELDSLPPELKCLVTLFLLTAVREHVRAHPRFSGDTRFVIVIEEAHNVVGRSGDAAPSEDNPDPKAFAAEYICRMLAELRALGVAIIIIDQLPSAVAPEVIKNTGSKLAFRLVDADDREIVGSAMLFGPVETEEVARLTPGEAYLYTEGYHGPQRIRTPDLATTLKLEAPPTDQELAELISREDWFVKATVLRSADELGRLRNAMDRFEEDKRRVHDGLKRIDRDRERILSATGNGNSSSRHAGLARCARSLRDRLAASLAGLRRGPYRNLLGAGPPSEGDDCGTGQLRAALVSRFETLIEPQTASLLNRLEELAGRPDRDQ